MTKLVLPVLGLLLANPTATYYLAETEATEQFEIKTYTFEDEDGYANLTLTTFEEYQMDIQYLEYVGGFSGYYTRIENVITLFYKANTITIEVNDETMTFAEYAPEANDPISDFVGEIKQFKNTYLVPIFGGVSISSIIGTIVSMVIVFVYKKMVKDLKERMEKLSSEDQQKNDDARKDIKKTLKDINEYIEVLKEEKEITEEMRDKLAAAVNKIADKIAELSNKTEQLAKLRTITTQLIKIIGAFVQTNKELVASGVGEEIEKLIEQAKSL